MKAPAAKGAVLLAAMGLIAGGAIGFAAGSGTTQPAGTTKDTSLRAVAQNLLETRGSMLSNGARIALGMFARGDQSLRPGELTHPDAIANGRARVSRKTVSTAPASDAQAAAIPTNVRVNDPAEDTHELDQTTQSETAMTVSGSHVAVGFNDSQTGLLALTSGDTIRGSAFSDNGGASFTDGGALPNLPGFVNIGDPWMATDSAGAMYYANLALNEWGTAIVVSRSDDFGHTWETPVAVSQPPGTLEFSDKDALTAGVGPHGQGSALYAAWDDFVFPAFGAGGGGGGGGGCPTPTDLPTPSGTAGPAGGTATPSGTALGSASPSPTPCVTGGPFDGLAVSHSTDGGRTWQLSYADQISANDFCSFGAYTGAQPVVGTSGVLYLVAEKFEVSDPTCSGNPDVTFTQRLFTSHDGGVTFSKGVTVANVNLVPAPFPLGAGSFMRDAEFPTITLHGGNIYVAWNDSGSPKGGTQIRLARSTDGGSTWSTSFVTSGADLRIQPSLTSDGAGLHLFYYRINQNQKLDAIAADSADGVTWQASRVNSVSFPGVIDDPQFDPLIAFDYMGDYIASVSAGGHHYYAWGDNRDTVTDFLWPRGRNDPDVFFARV